METSIGNERPNRGLRPHPHDRRTFSVARRVTEIVAVAVPGAAAEHIGSSSVAGLAGKNIVDVLLPLDAVEIPSATERLVAGGFPPQGGRGPVPPGGPPPGGAPPREGGRLPVHPPPDPGGP